MGLQMMFCAALKPKHCLWLFAALYLLVAAMESHANSEVWDFKDRTIIIQHIDDQYLLTEVKHEVSGKIVSLFEIDWDWSGDGILTFCPVKYGSRECIEHVYINKPYFKIDGIIYPYFAEEEM